MSSHVLTYVSHVLPSAYAGHYLALRNSTNFSADCPLAMVGLIDEKASPYAIALSAIEDAKYMCTRTHGDAPEVRCVCMSFSVCLSLTDAVTASLTDSLNHWLTTLMDVLCAALC